MPAPLDYVFSPETWRVIFECAVALFIELGLVLLEQARAFAVDRAAKYVLLLILFTCC